MVFVIIPFGVVLLVLLCANGISGKEPPKIKDKYYDKN